MLSSSTHPRLGRGVAATIASLTALCWLPTSAAAHGIGGSAADKSTLEFVPLGAEHMLLGWDHLLFILGIVLLAGKATRAAKLISVFVAGHSTTLIIATIADWRISATLVDVMIALSVVFVAVLGLRGRPKDFFWPGVAIFGFGLIHGLGLATRLLALGIPDEGLVGKTIAFNVGVELGQLAAVLAMLAVVWLIATKVPDWPKVRRAMYAVLTAAGLVAAGVLTATSSADDAAAPAAGGCTERELRSPGIAAGQHPERKFFEPTETVEELNFAHVIGDGWVIVRYRPDLPEADIAVLRKWVATGDKAIGAGPAADQKAAMTVRTASRELTCAEFSLTAAQEFARRWFDELRARG